MPNPNFTTEAPFGHAQGRLRHGENRVHDSCL